MFAYNDYGFGRPNDYSVRFPYWFAVLLATGFAAFGMQKLTWRFSLRTMLIATTLVAVGLGLIVWLTR